MDGVKKVFGALFDFVRCPLNCFIIGICFLSAVENRVTNLNFSTKLSNLMWGYCENKTEINKNIVLMHSRSVYALRRLPMPMQSS